MDTPPLVGDPYQFTAYTGPNQGQNGVIVGWDSVRYFWGTVAQQAVADLAAINGGGGILV